MRQRGELQDDAAGHTGPLARSATRRGHDSASRDQAGQAADMKSDSGSGASGPETPAPRPQLGERQHGVRQHGERQRGELQEVAAGTTGPLART
jgi:hypothetical protein